MLKVVVTGNSYSSLQLIQSFKQRKKVDEVKIAERRVNVQLGEDEFCFWYVPHWCGKNMERDCNAGDACILILYNGEYDEMCLSKPVYDEFKKVNGKRLTLFLHDEPVECEKGMRIAEEFGAEYVHLSEGADYEHLLKRIAMKCANQQV